MNKWSIPDWLEREVLARDTRCIYCGTAFAHQNGRRGGRPSWEHIVNDARIVTRYNIARCCVACNASKGSRPLAQWLQSRYCERKGITAESIAPIAQRALGVRVDEASG